jgi:hypothetical protein
MVETLSHGTRRGAASCSPAFFGELALLGGVGGGAGGGTGDAEIRLDWPYTQTEPAGMVGGSREPVHQLLADFAARGRLRIERDTLVVPHPGRLTAEAQG